MSQPNSSIDNTSLNANANEPESITKVMAYAMANLNSLNDHTYLSPSKTGCYTNPQPTTSTPAYSAQYPPPPIPPPVMMTNAQQGFAHYQQPPPQTDIGKMLSEVLNRISGLDEKLVRLDDIDKKNCQNSTPYRQTCVNCLLKLMV